MSTIEILENPFARIEVDRQGRLVRLTRSELPIEVEELDRAVDALELAIPLRERARYVILQDMRRAPLIRSDEVEKALLRSVPRLNRGFAARAVLLGSAVGMLQAKRFVTSVGGEARTFHDEGEALVYLRAALQKLDAPT